MKLKERIGMKKTLGAELKTGHTMLQVALDIVGYGLKPLFQIAAEAIRGGADMIEIGTPALKCFGIQAAKRLRHRFPEHLLTVDAKIADASRLEVAMYASELGPGLIITVLGAVNPSTIEAAVREAEKYKDVLIEVDLIGLMSPEEALKRAKQAESLGAHLVCWHLAIDEQLRGKQIALESVQALARAISLPLAVAGGITEMTAPKIAEAGADVIICGSAITKAPDPCAATAKIKNALICADMYLRKEGGYGALKEGS